MFEILVEDEESLEKLATIYTKYLIELRITQVTDPQMSILLLVRLSHERSSKYLLSTFKQAKKNIDLVSRGGNLLDARPRISVGGGRGAGKNLTPETLTIG